MTAEEYILKAENYAFAAKAAPPALQRRLIRAAAMCRNRALRITLERRRDLNAAAVSAQAFRRSY